MFEPLLEKPVLMAVRCLPERALRGLDAHSVVDYLQLIKSWSK